MCLVWIHYSVDEMWTLVHIGLELCFDLDAITQDVVTIIINDCFKLY